MNSNPSVKTLLKDETFIGQTVTLNGWIRNRRDSKAGLSFIMMAH